MDIEIIKKMTESEVKAGYITKRVRTVLKDYKHSKQDVQEELSETFKPVVKAQKETKEKTDENQNKMLEQLQKNQKAITSGLEDLALMQKLPGVINDVQQETTKLPIDYKPAMMEEKPPKMISEFDKEFKPEDIKTLIEYNLYAPSDVLLAVKNKQLDLDDYDTMIGN